MGVCGVVSRRLGVSRGASLNEPHGAPCGPSLRTYVATVIAGVALAAGIVAATTNEAEARSRHRGFHRAHHGAHASVHIRKHRFKGVRHARAAGGPGPAFAAMIVDANSGKTLFAQSENELRHPASVTKVMTLYMLFEQMERGKFQMSSPLTVSSYAASMAPSKLGLRPGATIEVEDAIRAVVTKSANDIAVTIAEAVGGDEDTFADMMTRKARALGMYRTVYKNASGLPNPQQVTTANDLTILGRAIQDRFPKYYRYFATRSFYWAGRSHRNHNHLLGRVEGMDGIKTGYTRASGFNLLTSVKRDGRHIVGVVLGGRSGATRDMIMANLIADNLGSGARARTAVAMAETSNDREEVVRPDPARTTVAFEPPARPEPPVELTSGRLAPMELASAAADPEPRASRLTPPAPIAARPVGLQLSVPPSPLARADRPRPAVVSGAPRLAAMDGSDETASLPPPRPIADGSTQRKPPTTQTATPSTMRWAKGPDGKQLDSKQTESRQADAKHADGKLAKDIVRDKTGRTDVAKVQSGSDVRGEAKQGAGKSWVIQIGATENSAKANDLLARAKSKSRAVASAQAVTEKVQKGKETLWRARFAGLQETSAEAACRDLKRSGFACIAMKN